MAQLAARRRLSVGQDFVHESIIGTLFECRVEAAAKVGRYAAIKPSVAGWAKVMGHNTIYVDDHDPLAHGFQLS
jgi:4-hydroxyproline epimerase